MTKPMIIISAHIFGVDSVTNAIRNSQLLHDILREMAWDVTVIPCTGRYNGIEEEGYIIYLPEAISDGIKPALTLLALAKKYNQESLLIIQPDYTALIQNLEGDILRTGLWTEYPEGTVPDLEDFTNILGVNYTIV